MPPTDPRTQWELDQETERLKRQAAEEERKLQKQLEAEQKQIKKMLQEEEKEMRKKQAEVDAETERLRKMYGQPNVPEIQTPARQQHRYSASAGPESAYAFQSGQTGPYMSGGASQSAFLQPSQPLKQKSSFFGFRRHSDQEAQKLAKKKSSNW